MPIPRGQCLPENTTVARWALFRCSVHGERGLSGGGGACSAESSACFVSVKAQNSANGVGVAPSGYYAASIEVRSKFKQALVNWVATEVGSGPDVKDR